MSAVVLFVLDVPEFAPVVSAARRIERCSVTGPQNGYHVIRSEHPLQFDRRALGLKPAVWYGVPTGGLVGEIERFDRDALIIHPVG